MFTNHCPAGETAAALRRLWFRLLDASHAPVTGASGTPAFSLDGAAFTSTGIGAATEVANGWYYADLDDADTGGTYVGYWKPGTTAERYADSRNALIVGGPVGDAMAFHANEKQVDESGGTQATKVYDKGGVSGGNVLYTFTPASGGTNKTNLERS